MRLCEKVGGMREGGLTLGSETSLIRVASRGANKMSAKNLSTRAIDTASTLYQ